MYMLYNVCSTRQASCNKVKIAMFWDFSVRGVVLACLYAHLLNTVYLGN